MSRATRIVNYGIQGFRRNIWLSLIAIVTMTLTIVTVTVFAVANLAATQKYKDINSKLDYNIFLKDGASDGDVKSFRDAITARHEVLKQSYISKDDALAIADANPFFSKDARAAITADHNPLPREIDVQFNDPSKISDFNTFVNSDKYSLIVESTGYQTNQAAIDNYLKLVNFLRVFGIGFTIFFLLIAVVVILNTIRLTIFSRRDEIEVMRLVGATSSFIRGPFLIEGMLFGLIGALVAALLCWFSLYEVQHLLSFGVATSTIQTLVSGLGYLTDQAEFNRLFAQLFALQVLIGVGLGTICSAIAIRRYLRE